MIVIVVVIDISRTQRAELTTMSGMTSAGSEAASSSSSDRRLG